MKRIFILIVVVIALVGIDNASAQSRTSYFMEGSYFRTDLNPALAPTRGYLALPGTSGVGLDVPNNFLSVDNFIYQKDGQMVTALHKSVSADEFLGKLPELGRFGVNANVNILGVGFHAGRSYWNFGLRVRSTTDINISKDLFSAIKDFGNGDYNLTGTNVNSNNYLETYLGASFPVGQHLNIGVRGKFLVGLANIHTEFDRVAIGVNPDKLSATLRGMVVANGVFVDQTKIASGAEIDISKLMASNPMDMLKNFKSFGAALDLGVEVKLLQDHLKVSAAITDLGFIKWHSSTNYAASAAYDLSFEGFDIDAGELKFNFDDELVNMAPSSEGYISQLNGALNVGVEYNFLRNHFAIGVMSHTELYNHQLYTELTASLNIRATNWLSATVSHTFLAKHKLGVLGAALNIHPSVINIFIGADFIDTRYATYKGSPVPRYMNALNLYAGVGFNFGRPKYIREAEREERRARREARRVN